MASAPNPIGFEDEQGSIGTYDIRALSWLEEAPFNRVIEKYAVEPIDAAKKLVFSLPEGSPERREVWESAKKAQARWSAPEIAQGAGRAIVLSNREAGAEIAELAFRRAKPDITGEELERLKRSLRFEDISLIHTALVDVPITAEDADPKAEEPVPQPGAVEETEEEKAERLRKENDARLLMLYQNELWQRAVSQYSWITPHLSSELPSSLR